MWQENKPKKRRSPAETVIFRCVNRSHSLYVVSIAHHGHVPGYSPTRGLPQCRMRWATMQHMCHPLCTRTHESEHTSTVACAPTRLYAHACTHTHTHTKVHTLTHARTHTSKRPLNAHSNSHSQTHTCKRASTAR